MRQPHRRTVLPRRFRATAPWPAAGIVQGRRMPAGIGEDALNGARILIVDDDVRSVFALTSVFERLGAEVLYAENGRTGIEALERNEDISLVLMDVMMPELDGNATHAGDPADAAVRRPADHRAHREGDEGRPGEEHQSRRVRLRPQAVETDHLLQLMRHWLQRSAGSALKGRQLA